MKAIIVRSKLDSALDEVFRVYGMEPAVCDTPESIEGSLAGETDAVGMCTLQPRDEACFSLPQRYPQIRWTAFAELGPSAEYEAAEQMGFTDILPMPATASNLFEALHHVASRPFSGHAFSHARFHWIRRGTEHFLVPGPEALTDNFDELDDIPQNAFQKLSLNVPCLSFTPKGSLIHTHFAAIVHAIESRRLTGDLHLWRESLHWCFHFEAGKADGVQTSDAFRYFEDLREKLSSVQEGGNPPSPERQKAIRRGTAERFLFEVFSWPDGDFEWLEQNQPDASHFNSNPDSKDVFCVLIQAVLKWVPITFILEVTHSCLSNFLKLKDNIPRLPEGAFPPEVMAVVEKLTKGGNLTEMLTENPDAYPVHQVVYLLLILGHIDLLA